MQTVPLQAVPSQQVVVVLNGQNCQFNVYQKFFGLFIDVYVSDVLIIGGVICQNLNRIVRSAYLGFEGDVGFWDTQGLSNPDYTGLGGRFQLVYLSPADLSAIGVPVDGS